MTSQAIDPITLSTIWNSFQSMGREMRHVIDRTAQNYLIAQLHDMAAGIWDAQARTIAVPEGPTSMFLSQQFSVEYILNKFGDDLHPGDIIICNDPYKGYCNHLPDWGFFRPIFYEDELVFVALTRGHQLDTGGSFPGGYFPNGYDIHAEGLMIPPIKIYDRGVERTDVLELIWNNVRWPDGVKIDNYALMAALQVCDNRVVALLDKYGKPTVKDAVEEMLDRMETNVRAQLAEVPDGTYYGESATDDDGTILDELVWVRCAATIKGDELILDFSESDAQRPGFVNCVYSSTYSRAVAGSFLYFDPVYSEFHNEGSMRPITVIAPEGSVCNAQYPATVGGSPVNVGTQVLEATVKCPTRRSPVGGGAAATTSPARIPAAASVTFRRPPMPTAAPAPFTATTALKAPWACRVSARFVAAASKRSRSGSRGGPSAISTCPTCRAPVNGAAAPACCGRYRTWEAMSVLPPAAPTAISLSRPVPVAARTARCRTCTSGAETRSPRPARTGWCRSRPARSSAK
jgi:N-methylhydantoinase B/oxoprolinase/acetone carboxylase alpha subunit